MNQTLNARQETLLLLDGNPEALAELATTTTDDQFAIVYAEVRLLEKQITKIGETFKEEAKRRLEDDPDSVRGFELQAGAGRWTQVKLSRITENFVKRYGAAAESILTGKMKIGIGDLDKAVQIAEKKFKGAGKMKAAELRAISEEMAVGGMTYKAAANSVKPDTSGEAEPEA